MPLYTPLSGSWLNMAESIQRILKRGHHPESLEQIMDWFEAVTKGWNQNPTPFIWDGNWASSRVRAKRYQLGGSGVLTHRSFPLIFRFLVMAMFIASDP